MSKAVEIEHVEKELDKNIKKYNGFSEKHPMDYVSYDTARNRFETTYKNTKIRKENKDEICAFVVEKHYNKKQMAKDVKLTNNYDNFIISYLHDNIELFDIQHIISVLNLSKRQMNAKYTSFSKKITYYMPVKNEFGGNKSAS